MDKEFEISALTAFLPEIPPLERLPDLFSPWENILDNIKELIIEKQLRKVVNDRLPLLTVSDVSLPTERHWNRAYCVLTFLSQGYLWQDGEDNVPTTLPKQLAVPWFDVSQRLGLPAVTTYAAVVLWNWKLKDPSSTVTVENIEMMHTYTGTRDEEWFYLISLAVELSAVKGIKEVITCIEGIKNKDISMIINSLENIAVCIDQMRETSKKMRGECKTDVFFQKVRPFQAGSKGYKKIPNGIIYDGVSDEPKKFNGASAAQSSTLPVFDILLGVEHSGEEKKYLDQQKWHMPRSHRQFLLALSLQTSLRKFVLENRVNRDLKQSYNKCIDALVEFRNYHIQLVTMYILNEKKKDSEDQIVKKDHINEDGTLDDRGTGGTPIMIFLKAVRDKTLENKICD